MVEYTKYCLDCSKPVKIGPRCRSCSQRHNALSRRRRTCERCGSDFYVSPGDPDRYCGWDCYKSGPRPDRVFARDTRTCEFCGAEFQHLEGQGKGRFCSRGCSYRSRRKPSIVNGYRYVWSDEGKVAEHRLVASRALGRPLLSDEHVHHIDEDPLNNSPENLVVLSRSEHTRLHHQVRFAK